MSKTTKLQVDEKNLMNTKFAIDNTCNLLYDDCKQRRCVSMYRDASNPVLCEENYIQSRVPDIVELGNLLKKGKGNNRTMAEYAKECGASPSTFSRIATGKITQPLSFETLVNIWKYADPNSRPTFIDLTKANGLVGRDFAENKERRRPGSFERDEEQFSSEREMKNIIMEELLERGLSVQQQKRIHIDENIPAVMSGAGRAGMILTIQGYEPKYWNIKAMSYIGVKRGFYGDEPIPEIDFECEADVMFHNSAEMFLKDAWEPERTKNIKMSFLFMDRETLEAFWRNLKSAKVNGCFSLILVDCECQEVIEERFVPRIDGTTMKSLFELPMVGENNDWREGVFWDA